MNYKNTNKLIFGSILVSKLLTIGKLLSKYFYVKIKCTFAAIKNHRWNLLETLQLLPTSITVKQLWLIKLCITVSYFVTTKTQVT
jgi:hypothetical protein